MSLEASLFRAATANPIGSRLSLSDRPWRPPARSRLQGSFCGSLAVFKDMPWNVTASYTLRHTWARVPVTPIGFRHGRHAGLLPSPPPPRASSGWDGAPGLRWGTDVMHRRRAR